MLISCPYCYRTEGQMKAGRNRTGSQRYKCSACRRQYTPAPRTSGYPEEVRRQALQMRAEGIPLRQISRSLGVNHQSVANWFRQQESASAAPSAGSADAESASAEPGDENGTGSARRRATIADVARQAGVSVSTVSNLLNQKKGRMSEETRRRIHAAMEELHFTPNALMRAIRHRRTRMLGVLLFDLDRLDQDIEHTVTIPLLAGIYEAANAAEHDVVLYTGWPDRPARHSGLDFLSGQVDGLLWAIPGIGAPALARVAAAGLPVMAMLSRHVPEGVGYVNGDNVAAMRDVVAHLVTRGHRRIAFAGAEVRASNPLDRLEGYRQGLKAAGLPLDPALEAAGMNPRRFPEVYAGMVDAWLALPAPPSAIVCQNDEWAWRISEALRARGLRVPEDMALAGFDDVPAAQGICGGLTTVRQPFHEIGGLAAERLLALIEGAPVSECRVSVPVSLVVRASTGGTP